MKNGKNDFEKVEGRLRSFFQKRAESLKTGKGLWSKLEPQLGEQEKTARNVKFGRWLAGPRLVVVSTSLSVVLILIVVGSVWLTSYHPNNNQSKATASGLDRGAIGEVPPVQTITTATTTTALAPVPATPPEIKAGISGDGSVSYGSESFSSTILDTTQREVIYQATISLTVNTVSTAINQVQTIAQSAGGLVESMSSGGGQDQQQATITIRVPQDQFFTALNKLQDLGTVQNQNVSSQDVTQQFIDLQARLKSAQLEEQSLQSLLDKAQTISDIINIQQQLTQVRAQIESLQGQINYIQNRVDMATITVNLNVAAKNVGQPPSASLTVAVSNVDGSLASVKQVMASVNGVIDANTVSLNNGKESAYLSLRVSRSTFDQVLTAIEREGKTQQKTVQEAVGSQVDQSQQTNIPPDAVITLSLVEVSGFWTAANIAVVAISGGVVIVALLVFLGLAWRAGLLRKRAP